MALIGIMKVINSKFTIILVLLPILILGVLAFKSKKRESEISTNTTIIKIADHRLTVEIADEPDEQARGLSSRESMAKNKGMLFVFSKLGKPGFWMKDMKFTIDIIWIKESGEIIGITKNISPNTFPEAFYPPSEIKYVLEVNAEWSDRNNIKIGDAVSF